MFCTRNLFTVTTEEYEIRDALVINSKLTISFLEQFNNHHLLRPLLLHPIRKAKEWFDYPPRVLPQKKSCSQFRKDGPLARHLVVAVAVLSLCGLVFNDQSMMGDTAASRSMTGDTAAASLATAMLASDTLHENMHKSCLVDPLPPVRVREDMAAELEAMNFTSGIEIGVQRGIFSEHNLQNWPSCQKYYLVDLWGQQPNYKDVANVNDEKQQQLFEETKTRLAPYENKIEYYRMYSNEAAQKLAQAGVQVDFVYVDARHDYCGCKEDIELYWPLLKPGGVMAGHDFSESSEVRGQDWSVCMDGSIHPEAVRGAVIEFSKKHKLAIGVTYREKNFNSWWIRKPLC